MSERSEYQITYVMQVEGDSDVQSELSGLSGRAAANPCMIPDTFSCSN